MLDNFFLLKNISKFLNEEISGFFIKEIHTQEKDKLVFNLCNKLTDTVKFIEFSSDNKLPYLFLKDNYKKAKKNVLNLFPGLYEQEIKGISVFNNDRIIKVSLSGELIIFIVFFKLKCNLLVVVDNKIIDAFKNKKDIIGLPLDNILSRRVETKKKSVSTVKDYIAANYRQYGDLVLKEMLYILNLKGSDKICDDLKIKIDVHFQKSQNTLENPEYLIYKNENNYFISPIRLNHLKDYEVTEYKNVNDSVIEYLKLFYREYSDKGLREKVLVKKDNLLKNSEKKYFSLLKQIEVSKNSSQFKTYGDIILSNIHLIKKGDDVLRLNEECSNVKIEIPLKRELSPAENANMYYEKYKRQKNSIDLLNNKIEKQKKEIELIKKEIEDLKNNKDLKTIKMEEKEINKNDETSRFRKFKLDEKLEVWVGKDSASNDLLTMRYSSQNDLWFHVRGASGSHTVLKISDKKNPPEKKFIATAASIAAYYSKARNASNVPVAYCERKYVKKKKGFKEGSVIMEREKVIFVKPGLPENLN